MKQMPESRGMVIGRNGNINAEFLVDGRGYNLELYVTSDLPDFNVSNAMLSYESPSDFQGHEILKPSSRVGEDNIDLILMAPSGDVHTITGRLERPLPDKFRISGQGSWGK
jgi:hypothetical protein